MPEEWRDPASDLQSENKWKEGNAGCRNPHNREIQKTDKQTNGLTDTPTHKKTDSMWADLIDMCQTARKIRQRPKYARGERRKNACLVVQL
ncbi:unnamed protein product [Brugia pahangi]|uniref:Uncharacterized protein n=1 Tax=Brugia pahangi TaxID=6280 RepID=A0A0N4TV13_BRUPA|nr:unnamed protein product [Brugia pahangi]